MEHQRRAIPVAERWRDKRRAYQEEGRKRARQGDRIHQAGCMLYWAEGRKSRNWVSLTNSDLHLVCYFRRFLVDCFGIADTDMTLRLHFYSDNGLSVEEIEEFWLRGLALPRSTLRKHRINVRPASSKGTRGNKLPYGVCTLDVKKSTRLAQHIFGAIQEYAGFDEPRWLG